MEFWRNLISLARRPLDIGIIELPFSLQELVLILILPVIVYYVIYRLLRLGWRRLSDRMKVRPETKARTGRWVVLILRLLFLTGILSSLGALLGAEVLIWYRRFLEFLGQPLYVSGNTRITLTTFILFIPLFALAGWSGRKARRLLERSVFPRLGLCGPTTPPGRKGG